MRVVESAERIRMHDGCTENLAGTEGSRRQYIQSRRRPPSLFVPSDQEPSLTAFFSKFLLDQPANKSYGIVSNYAFKGTVWNSQNWIDWTTPTLA